jgi:hypothetical protein
MWIECGKSLAELNQKKSSFGVFALLAPLSF